MMDVAPQIPTSLDARTLARRAAHGTWRIARTAILALLTLLEPVVRTVVSVLMVLGITVAVVFEVSAVGPKFSFATIIVMSMALGAFLVAYYALLALLSR